jgi:general secretion pathway protein G
MILDYTRPGTKQVRHLTWVDWMWPEDWIRLGLFAVLAIFVIGWILCVPTMVSHNPRAQQTKAIADIYSMKTALDSFNTDNGRYPTNAEGLQALITNPGNLQNWKRELNWGGATSTIPTDPWHHDFIYRVPGMGKPYELFSAGPDGIAGTPDDIFQ